MSDTIDDALVRDGFTFLHRPATQDWLARHGTLSDWAAFAASWNGMAQDTYMADGGRYRRRRHGVFSVSDDQASRREADQPHYQSRDYNALNGGVARWFEPMQAATADCASFRTILAATHALFATLHPGAAWHIEAHQFRIEARAGEAGQPTPEGLHRDGVDYVLVLLIDRQNIASGTTTIHGLDHMERGSFTLTAPLDAALVDDSRVFHGVTAVVPINPAMPAHRDVLVLTYRAKTAAEIQAG